MKSYNADYLFLYEFTAYDILQKKIGINFITSWKNRYKLKKDNPVNGDDILLKESLDHLATKELLENSKFYPNYIRIIQEEINIATENQKLRPLHNHFLNTISDDKLKELLPPNLFETIIALKENQRKRTTEIMEKIKKNKIISQEELDFICDCYAFNRDKNDENHRILIEYIFNTLTKPDNQNVANQFVSDAILSFIPKYFKTKDNQDFSEIRIVNDSNYTGGGGSGLYKVVIERDLYITIDFKNTNGLNNLCDYHSNDYICYLFTIFHELTHNDQGKKIYSKTFSDDGYMAVASQIFKANLNDYGFNHDDYETEIDADQKAWLYCKDFFQDFIKDEELKKHLSQKCIENSIGSHFRRATSQKKDQETNTNEDTDFFDIEKLNEIIRKNPKKYLKIYPMLKTFYNEWGYLDLSFLSNPKIRESVIGKNYIKYVLLKDTNWIAYQLKQTKNKTSFSRKIANIYAATMDENQRINVPDFIKKRNIANDRKEHTSQEQKEKAQRRRLKVLNAALTILNDPYVLKRKTNFFSPIIYMNRIASKLKEPTLEPATAHSK